MEIQVVGTINTVNSRTIKIEFQVILSRAHLCLYPSDETQRLEWLEIIAITLIYLLSCDTS